LIVHVSEKELILPLVKKVTPLAEKLILHFWPGPLTLILKKSDAVPDLVTAGLDTVALRMPSHPLARRLIALSGVPVAAPSANLSGRPSPTMGAHVVSDLNGRVDAIIDGGNCDVGLESTVVDATGLVPVILRPGGITREMLTAAVGPIGLATSSTEDPALTGETPRSPGMKYTHYAPRAKLIIAGITDSVGVIPEPQKSAEDMLILWRKHRTNESLIGVLCTNETAALLDHFLNDEQFRPLIKTLGSTTQPEKMAARLFAALREFDETPVTLILAERVSDDAIGYALMNRLIKAAGVQQGAAEMKFSLTDYE
jgi:L-threonylcarbamoyladenylate synthase